MDPDPPKVAPDTDQERAARGMVDRHECSLAVVDADGRFLGLIPPYRMLRVLLEEHEEDLARLGGYRLGTARARGAAEEPVAQRLWHRLPWLLVGLLGAMAATAIVGGFEQQLEANVLLAFFIPAVVYMADAVGTQTETVLIRALAAGVTVRSVLAPRIAHRPRDGHRDRRAFLAFALVGWGDLEVAVAVALAMFASCSIATLVAMACRPRSSASARTRPSAPGRWRRFSKICSRSLSTWRSSWRSWSEAEPGPPDGGSTTELRNMVSSCAALLRAGPGKFAGWARRSRRREADDQRAGSQQAEQQRGLGRLVVSRQGDGATRRPAPPSSGRSCGGSARLRSAARGRAGGLSRGPGRSPCSAP